MWVRHKCTICNGTGKIEEENCDCQVFPDYMKIFPNADWQKTIVGANTEAQALIYACGDEGCLIIDSYSNVTITGVGRLMTSMTPRTVEELNNLCVALKLEIIYK